MAFSYINVLGNFTIMSLTVITLSTFFPNILLLRPLYSSLAPTNSKLVMKSNSSVSNEFGQKIKSKLAFSPLGIVTIKSLISSSFSLALSASSSSFLDDSSDSSSSSKISSFFSFSIGLIIIPFSFSFSCKMSLKSLYLESLLNLTMTLAERCDLLFNVNNLVL